MPRARLTVPPTAAVHLEGPETLVRTVLPLRDAIVFPRLVTTLNVARPASRAAIDEALEGDRRVLLVLQRDMNVEVPRPEDLFRHGVLAEIVHSLELPDGNLRVAVRGVSRIRVPDIVVDGVRLQGEWETVVETEPEKAAARPLKRALIQAFQSLVEAAPGVPAEVLASLVHVEGAGELADAVAFHLPGSPLAKQEVLEETDVLARLRRTIALVTSERQALDARRAIEREVEAELGAHQRVHLLREQLRAIHSELRRLGEEPDEAESYRQRAADLRAPEAVLVRVREEAGRLERAQPGSPEALLARTALDLILSLPWSRSELPPVDLAAASAILDEAHIGLGSVKRRILQALAVESLTGGQAGAVLCLVGPPGVGKTSIARAVAQAAGRPFVRIALGGVRDEAELRGHRRAYVGAGPGRLVQALRQAGSSQPVILLDELDKLGADRHGDPASVLLEALDREQNHAFHDHFLELPVDLSQAMFLATANVLDPIPSPLRDRLEVLEFPGYTLNERVQIAAQRLLPRAVAEHGLCPERVQIEPEALREIARTYTREAGVRQLRRALDALCRAAALRTVEGDGSPVRFSSQDLAEALGAPPTVEEGRGSGPGSVAALVVGWQGGGVVEVEARVVPGEGPPHLRRTGSLGETLQESIEAALTCVRPLMEAPLAEVHVHVPAAATPKDGPSAGLAIALALLSAAEGRPVKAGLGATGEITLSGSVRAVGGLREKLLGAARAGLTDVLIPSGNAPELATVPEEATSALRIHVVSTLEEACALAFGETA